MCTHSSTQWSPVPVTQNAFYKFGHLTALVLAGCAQSSFINYVLKRDVQTAGVAPTDDSFTIIAPGTSDIDQDGPALIGDPDMG